MLQRLALYVLLIAVAVGAWWWISQEGGLVPAPYDVTQDIVFLDDVEAHDAPPTSLTELTFVDPAEGQVTLGQLQGDRNLVVVVTRGNTGAVCPYCSTQTSRLIANYGEFVERDTEVVVIYPIEQEEDASMLKPFLEVTRQHLGSASTDVPFPLVLDVGLQAVDELGLRDFLSKPATYILDRSGQVRFAYVGSNLADRPSVKALLEQVDALPGDASQTAT